MKVVRHFDKSCSEIMSRGERGTDMPSCVVLYHRIYYHFCGSCFVLPVSIRLPWPLVRNRTILTERPPLVDEI
jgi:hypothetical protein